jgi:hypothetical protein
MPFVLPEITIESILRDGFKNARRNSDDVIRDVFGNLTRAFADKKYGEKEINKIKKLVEDKEVSIVHSFNMVQAEIPCISIQLVSDTEDERKAHLGDHVGFYDMPFVDQSKSVIVSSFETLSYDQTTGIVTVPDSVNLAPVYANLLFVDQAGLEFQILGGIDNTPGQKKFAIQKQAEVVVGISCEIKTSINFDRYQTRGNVEKVNILLGIHTQDPLLTKYVYTLVKYFLLSRKKDLINRDIQLSTYTGSDFTRNGEYAADAVYSRYLTVNGMVQHDWRSDLVELVDSVEVNVKVPADKFGNKALELENQTVKVNKP